jgi:hypothetical protein
MAETRSFYYDSMLAKEMFISYNMRSDCQSIAQEMPSLLPLCLETSNPVIARKSYLSEYRSTNQVKKEKKEERQKDLWESQGFSFLAMLSNS